MPHSLFLLLAALDAFVGIAAGAFGAHALKAGFSAYQMDIYRTAVEYQMWHGLGLGLIAVIAGRMPASQRLVWAGWLMQVGIILFSGSLYVLALSGIRTWGMVTPFGGVAFLLAWLLLGSEAWCWRQGVEEDEG